MGSCYDAPPLCAQQSLGMKIPDCHENILWPPTTNVLGEVMYGMYAIRYRSLGTRHCRQGHPF
eukprot:2522446-Amphidinium_carterae.1